jgi:putative transposase
MALWREDPNRFRGRPGLPRYLEKQTGRFVLVYTLQALSKVALRSGIIQPSGLNIAVQTQQTLIAQVRIVPKDAYYVVEVVYEREITPAAVDPGLAAAIDLGLNNLAAITSDKAGFIPVLVNGRPLKRFIQMLSYKAALVGIRVVLVGESHTSKCSFLDNEPIQHHDHYAGRRTHRGLFRASDGRRINADINGSYNILRKAIPNAFGQWDRGWPVVHPVGKAPTN